jgi:hypothetical protein
MMPRASRLVGLFTSLFLVAFVLVTSGFACIAPANPQGMGAMGMTPGHSQGQATVQDAAPVQKVPSAPCKFPWTPQGCQGMVSCAPAALASATTTRHGGALVPERVMADANVTPLSVTTPPELPPPRV